MTAPELRTQIRAREPRTPQQLLQARDRQVCQAAGLRALAGLVEKDEDVSELLAYALTSIGEHRFGGDQCDELKRFSKAAQWAGAVLMVSRSSTKYYVVEVAWSQHFGVRVQCDRPQEAPNVDDTGAGIETGIGVSA